MPELSIQSGEMLIANTQAARGARQPAQLSHPLHNRRQIRKHPDLRAVAGMPRGASTFSKIMLAKPLVDDGGLDFEFRSPKGEVCHSRFLSYPFFPALRSPSWGLRLD